MKLLSIIFVLSLAGCAHPPHDGETTREPAGVTLGNHQTVFPHPHSHKKGCGHKEKIVDGQVAYDHNGETHLPHAGHVDKK